jgi:cytosine/adenosine deaminase-related metal-dependent hydrolase
VNAHCHLELSHLQGRVDGSRGFVPWVASLVELREREGAGESRAAAAQAIRAIEECGTVAVGDVSNALGHLDLLAGARCQAVVFHELLGWDPGRASRILAKAERGMTALRDRLAGTHVQVRLAAHAPHSVSAPLLRGLVERGGPAAIHLAESVAETRFLAHGDGDWASFLRARVGDVAYAPPGLSPVAYLESLGALHPGLVAAHCVQVDEADCGLLARRRVHVAVCPRSNRNLGVGIPPVPELLAAGVPLCLGTDSLASVDTLDLVDDMVALQREFPGLAAETIVRLATRGGAEALGLDDLGSLAPGRRAALAYAPAEQAPSDPCQFLVSGAARVRRVEP